MIRACVVVFSGLGVSFSPCVKAAGSSLPQDIAECRKIADVSARAACYDQIEVPEATSADPGSDAVRQSHEADSSAGEQDSVYKELTDDVGFPESADSGKPIRITIVRCEAGNYRNFYFHLENGQIWKYIGGKKLRYKKCVTSADLVEDNFGFTLQMDGDQPRHRVKRIK